MMIATAMSRDLKESRCQTQTQPAPPPTSHQRGRCALARKPGSCVAPGAGARAQRGVSVSGANFRRSEVARRIGAMSGDSSGRRSEGRGRGRGRDPHRDRTRSRSRSRSPLARRGAAPERREAAERPSLEDTEPSDSGDEMIDPACLEAEYDQGLCRQIRHQYRALINSVQRKVALWGCAGRRRSVAREGGGRCGRRPVGVGSWLRACLFTQCTLHDLGAGQAGALLLVGNAGGQSWW